ncbi:MBL fold metallo-hydrolase [Legionella tucsonensis]|uniref:Zn-dependent hydrolase GumP n=1 Tax=Legionella tucsonensis TaxID=40335 RepID=A0A0W0ZZM8_9GAMM|nr:MBL fold metallo-hydrolase [Legionella tucsonensis]KTD74556.1 Zn-dependent hydrolase GumP [Legionella tucsonensis]
MIEYQLFEAGYCTHCEKMTLKSGHWKQYEYPAICALIKHPFQGYILFDTGYSRRFNDLTQKFPFSIYRRLTPMVLKKSLKEQLAEHNIQASEIKAIVISHFHADHIGGLKDFPNAQFFCHPDAINDIRHKAGIKALMQGFLPELLPKDFYERLVVLKNEIVLKPNLSPFTAGFDLFSDDQLIAIPLPGHAKGQIGLYFKAAQETFLVADSCWHQETFKNLVYPSLLTYLLHDNKEAYIQTIKKLHQLFKNNKKIDIIPSHCQHIRARLLESQQ